MEVNQEDNRFVINELVRASKKTCKELITTYHNVWKEPPVWEHSVHEYDCFHLVVKYVGYTMVCLQCHRQWFQQMAMTCTGTWVAEPYC